MVYFEMKYQNKKIWRALNGKMYMYLYVYIKILWPFGIPTYFTDIWDI
jgi:hypothetical protein